MTGVNSAGARFGGLWMDAGLRVSFSIAGQVESNTQSAFFQSQASPSNFKTAESG
jgi:hypothetical protein